MNVLIAKLIINMQNMLMYAFTRLFFRNRIEKINSILIYRTCALGDFIFAIPSIVALRERFPKAKIVLLTTSTTEKVVRELVEKYIDSSRSFPWLSFVVPTLVNEAVCFYSLNLKKLRSEIRPRILSFNPDITFILPHPGDSGVGLLKKLVLLRGLGVRRNVFGWHMRSSSRFLREAQYRAGLFEHKIFGPLRALDDSHLLPRIEDLKIKFQIDIAADSEAWAKHYWFERGWHRCKVVAISPGSIQPHKRWPQGKFVSLCKLLIESYNVTVVIIGTKNDYDLGEHIKEQLDAGTENLAGIASISQAAALLKRCTLLVGNDGGSVHLAAAIGCPAISIIPGLEYPGSIDPWNYASLSVRHPVSCAPCYSMTFCPEGHNRCMIDLPLDEVFRKCSLILGGPNT